MMPLGNLPLRAAPHPIVHVVNDAFVAFILIFVAPVLVSAAIYGVGNRGGEWRSADRSSAGLLLPAWRHREAVVRIFSARTVSWRGIVATHCWLVIKDVGASAYQRFDYTAWGSPIWVDRFVADGLWFGAKPKIVFAADGGAAERMVPQVRRAVASYRFADPGDYRAWPGPNSNTFVAAVIAAVPAMRAALPSTAIGKDFPFDGRWIGPTPSRTGLRLSLGGYVGLTFGWVEGFEVNLLGAVAGIDVRRPALKLPAVGRIGF